MAKPASRKLRCLHVPAKPDTLQTACERCGKLIEPVTPDSDRWRLL
jgi:hypothetical protein